MIKVDIAPPDDKEKEIVDGIYARADVIAGVKDATDKISSENPDKIITIGGTCFVSFAPFDYLKGRYENVGIIWIDAHLASKRQNMATLWLMPWCLERFWEVVTLSFYLL